ncbi:efflux RND transporter periplasmic adaptor subunit [Methyloterricola oryzae]|uniref:efflux RND transporter periplasmic adaptor subunit n=1 Tax=Methyloterricola oryzae TaxID=1495050 RepID=UPI0005EB7CB8|nr:efflux RND transporter periplasmic adaptor subunit [Methyloterricola oryzae]
MNKSTLLALVAAAAVGAAADHWWSVKPSGTSSVGSTAAVRKPLYYRNPMNPTVTSSVPAKDEMGMDYVPVYEADLNGGAEQPGKILYYRNPMGLDDTSPMPKKDAMGMDYIPVFADEAGGEDNNLVKISSDKIQKLGVRMAEVKEGGISRTVHAVGVIEADERKLSTVALKFDAFIEKLYVNATGQFVSKGQPLFDLYSPDLLSAQREYLTAKNGLAMLANSEPWMQDSIKELAQSGLEKLRNWGVSETEIRNLEKQGKAQRTLVIRSPASGIVMEKTALAGMRAAAGDTLFKIADLSSVWVIAEVYEQEIGLVSPGQPVRVMLDAYPGRPFNGKVTFIYPTLNPETRTVKVRIELPNPQGLLKPMMYAHVEMVTAARLALVVPRSSVLDGGKQTLVLVERGEGRFEPRPVKLGMRGDDTVEVLEGVRSSEKVVVAANFLIDAESNLRAALNSFGAHVLGPEASKPEPPPEQGDNAASGKSSPAADHAGHDGM